MLLRFEIVPKNPVDNPSGRLANNVFVTGGVASIPGLKQRLEAEIQCVRPFGSKFHVSVADDTCLDAWRGASVAAAGQNSDSLFLSREKYYECGEGYLEEHLCSNRYFPTPSTNEKLDIISNPTTPSISYPPTPLVECVSSNPSSP